MLDGLLEFQSITAPGSHCEVFHSLKRHDLAAETFAQNLAKRIGTPVPLVAVAVR